MQTAAAFENEQTRQLLLSVAEQLKVPLTHIARQTELAGLPEATSLNTRAIQIQTTIALALVDNYLLGLELLSSQTSLELEPVSVSSLLVDTAHALDGHAKQYGVDVSLQIAGRYEPVMAHQAGLRAALLSLGYAMVEAQATTQGPRRLVLAGHRKSSGIVAGMYGNDALDPALWRKALQLCGQAGQPLAEVFGTTGAGVFVADMLAQAMESKLRIGRHDKQSGFALTLQPSHQLQLV